MAILWQAFIQGSSIGSTDFLVLVYLFLKELRIVFVINNLFSVDLWDILLYVIDVDFIFFYFALFISLSVDSSETFYCIAKICYFDFIFLLCFVFFLFFLFYLYLKGLRVVFVIF